MVSLCLFGVNDAKYCSQSNKNHINGSKPIWIKGIGMFMYLAPL